MLLTLAACEALLCIGHCQLVAAQTPGPHHAAGHHHAAGDASPTQHPGPHAACAHHTAGDTQGAPLGEPRVAAISALALLAALTMWMRASAPSRASAESLALPPLLRPPILAAR